LSYRRNESRHPTSASADIWGPPAAPTSAPSYQGVDARWDEATTNVLGVGRTTSGNIVGFWQAYLNQMGQLPCASQTGYWNSGSTTGTKNLQTFFGITSDGLVGPQTWDASARWVVYVSSIGGYFQVKAPGNASANLFGQAGSGAPFAGYWYFEGAKFNPTWTWINTNLGTPTFTPFSC
jgi:hypothetical protein